MDARRDKSHLLVFFLSFCGIDWLFFQSCFSLSSLFRPRFVIYKIPRFFFLTKMCLRLAHYSVMLGRRPLLRGGFGAELTARIGPTFCLYSIFSFFSLYPLAGLSFHNPTGMYMDSAIRGSRFYARAL